MSNPTALAMLSYDEAWLNIASQSSNTFTVWVQSEECYQCDLVYKSKLFAYDNASVLLNVAHNVVFELRNESNSAVCRKLLNFQEHGIYSMNVTEQNSCPLVQATNVPDHIYNPLYAVLGLYVTVLLGWKLSKTLYRSQWMSKLLNNNPVIAEIETDLGSPQSSGDSVTLLRYSTSAPSTPPNQNTPKEISRTRVRSLDVLRGVAICMMIFVNYGGGKYALFEHSAWNGMTLADFVFPWFVWIMGVSLTFSLCSKLRSGSSRPQLFFSVLRRSLLLIAMGLLLSNWNHKDLYTIRYMGVLQRLGLAYFFVGSVETFLMRIQPIFTYDPHGSLYHARDLIESWPQWLFTLVTITLHTAITFYLPLGGGCPTGYLGPGGWAQHGAYSNCTGGAAGHIDRMVLGKAHMYKNQRLAQVYGPEVAPFDPEGLLGTLTTIVLMYLGVYAGRVMLCYQKTETRIIRWMVSAAIFGLIGGWLCNFSPEGGLIPLNKNLWSLSFVLITAASSSILLSIFLFLVDHWQAWSGTPFHQAGKNAIFLYIGHSLTRNTLPWCWNPTHTHTHTEFTVMNVWASALWLLIAMYMYETKCFFRV
uniref:Heparan-alpha-glucosaminide N-acetyltransferase n=1 Tax=Cacopsylla melanoneura TaxID=428564 RepID=A0A8D8TKV5_9HEMI